jgi:hypothetical protein
MSLQWLWKLTLLIGMIPRAAGAAADFGPGEAAARSQPGRSTRQVTGNADFKVLVWYRRADPLATFKYEIYDLRKGEYTAAVDAWIADVPTKYPAYIAVVRDVDLKREKGGTEKLKVGSVIQRELMVAAASSGVVVGGPLNISPAPAYSLENVAPRVNRQPGPRSSDRSFLNPGPTPFPVPMPYPRPHP